MICPFCDHPDHRVVESRVPDTKDAIRRRRECLGCGRRFTTYERVEDMPLVVVKSSGEREPFDRDKLLAGLQRACHKRPVATGLLTLAVRDIESELRNRLRQEVRSSVIGELALRRLKEIDPVAYVRFASVYRQFADVEEFEEELARLEREPPLPRGQVPLDEHLFDTLDVPPRNAARVRLRALRGGRDTPGADEAPSPDPTPVTTTREIPDGD
ncbi:MAG TPA: transcriptional regulator NrdR [Miltoncostaeaceae bacterium]|jgi:transcriptional repressor NrdR|nr:transcriptional regulator NrdR [Miltoncostaeaceae bacterium]